MGKLDQYLDALIEVRRQMDPSSHWPCRVEKVAPYLTEVETRDIKQKIKRIHEERIPLARVTDCFPSPSFIREVLPELIVNSKYAGLHKKERVRMVKWFFTVLERLQYGDIFCRNGKNALLTFKELGELLSSSQWVRKPSKKDMRDIHRFSTSLLSLMWSLYFYAWPNIGFEIHGPYDVSGEFGEATSLIVRDFFNIKPTSLWPQVDDMDFSNVTLLTVYHNVHINIGIFDRMDYSTDLSSVASAYAIYIDDKPVNDLDLVENHMEHCLQKASTVSRSVEEMSQREVLSKFIEIRYYGFKKFREFFNEDWHPPTQLKELLEERGPIKIREDGRMDPKKARRVFDPRREDVYYTSSLD